MKRLLCIAVVLILDTFFFVIPLALFIKGLAPPPTLYTTVGQAIVNIFVVAGIHLVAILCWVSLWIQETGKTE